MYLSYNYSANASRVTNATKTRAAVFKPVTIADQTVATTLTITPSSSYMSMGNFASPFPQPASASTKMPQGEEIGIIVGSVVGFLILVGLCVMYAKKRAAAQATEEVVYNTMDSN